MKLKDAFVGDLRTALDVVRYAAYSNLWVAIEPRPFKKVAVIVKEEVSDERCKQIRQCSGAEKND